MLGFRQWPDPSAAFPQNTRETADPVEFSVAQENPFRFVLAWSDTPEPDTDELIQGFGGVDPWRDRIVVFFIHVFMDGRIGKGLGWGEWNDRMLIKV